MKREIINSGYEMRLVALQEPHKGVILQSATGEELRPFREAGRTLLPSVPYTRVSASVAKTSPKTQREYQYGPNICR